MDGHRGRLFVEGNKHGLYAGITTDARRVRVTTRDSIWTWPLRDVRVRRISGTEYALSLGGEAFVFEPDDPVVFTFDFVDAIGDRPLARRRIRRRPRGHPADRGPEPVRPATPPPPTPEPVGASLSESEIWTDLAAGREEASLLETLSSLSAPSDHDHQWEAQRSGVQVCTECHQVFVDLIAVERSEDQEPSQG